MAIPIGDELQSAYLFGYLGCAAALIIATIGSVFATAKAAISLLSENQLSSRQIVQSLCTIVIAGILGIYGLIVTVIISAGINDQSYTYRKGCQHLAAGLVVGFCSMFSGIGMGFISGKGINAIGRETGMFGTMILILIFTEALALYGLIAALIICNN